MNLTGKTVLITGGASGIGLALAEAFLARDNTVLVCGRSPDKLAAAKRRFPALHTLPCDVRRAEDRIRLHEAIAADFPALNVVVHNAGVMTRVDLRAGAGAVMRTAEDELATNLTAPVHLSLLLLPGLLKQREAAIVNVSTGFAYTPAAPMPFYSASKAALRSFTLSLRRQLSGTPVRVFEVVPPVVETEMSRDFGGAKMKPGPFAAAVMRGLGADRPEIRVGQAGALYWLSRLAPQLSFAMVSQAVEKPPAPAIT